MENPRDLDGSLGCLYLGYAERGSTNGVGPVEPGSSNSPPDWHAICQGRFPYKHNTTGKAGGE